MTQVSKPPHVKALVHALNGGDTITIQAHGKSMAGLIESGQWCTIAPIRGNEVELGDIVLCKVHQRYYLHLVSDRQVGRFQISNKRGWINGWVEPAAIFGKGIRIDLSQNSGKKFMILSC